MVTKQVDGECAPLEMWVITLVFNKLSLRIKSVQVCQTSLYIINYLIPPGDAPVMMKRNCLWSFITEGKCCLFSLWLKSTHQFWSVFELSDLESVNSGNIDLQSSIKSAYTYLHWIAIQTYFNTYAWSHI